MYIEIDIKIGGTLLRVSNNEGTFFIHYRNEDSKIIEIAQTDNKNEIKKLIGALHLLRDKEQSNRGF